MTNKNDYMEMGTEMRCPFCEERKLSTYLFNGSWIYKCHDCSFVGVEGRTDKDIENLQKFVKLWNTEVEDVLNYKLEYENKELDVLGKTVGEFITDPYAYENLFALNDVLVRCGIKPIEKIKKNNKKGK